MKQQYLLNDYLEHEERKTFKDILLYFSLAFRPISTLLICVFLSIVIGIPCGIILMNTQENTITYNISFAILTGVIASGLVSLAIEMVNNYRHNYQRLLVLHEYLLTVAKYEEKVQWCFHGRKDNDCPKDMSARNMAVSELVLEIGPVVETAYKDGKEYMSLEEMKNVIMVIESASKIGELAESFTSDNMLNPSSPSLYKGLKKVLRKEIFSFANDVGITIVEDHLTSVVADYILTNPDVLDDYERGELVDLLQQFDSGMQKLQNYIKNEPGYHVELIPWEKRIEKVERKWNSQYKKSEMDIIERVEAGLSVGRITQSEYDEFMDLDAEIDKHEELNLQPLYDKYGYDDDSDAFYDEMDKMVKKQTDQRHKKLLRKIQIIEKANGRNIDVNKM